MRSTLHIVCPQCNRANRVITAKLGEHPHCEACGERLFTGEPTVFTTRNFHEHVRHNDIPVVVEFWSESSTPSQHMQAAFHDAVKMLEPRARMGTVDCDSERELALRHAIHALPTVAVYRHGGEVARRSGNLPLQALVEWLQQHAHVAPHGLSAG